MSSAGLGLLRRIGRSLQQRHEGRTSQKGRLYKTGNGFPFAVPEPMIQIGRPFRVSNAEVGCKRCSRVHEGVNRRGQQGNGTVSKRMQQKVVPSPFVPG